MEIETKKRHRGETLRPAVSISRDLWGIFCLRYPLNEHRNEIIENLIREQITNQIVDAPQMDFKV